MKKWYHDSAGNVSSKRIAGAIVTLTGVAMAFWGASTTNVVLIDYSKWAIGFGAGLLAIGVVERRQ